MNAPAIARREPRAGLVLPLAAAFVVVVGCGVVRPVLPFVLARDLGEAARAAIAWYTGLLTGVDMLALFLLRRHDTLTLWVGGLHGVSRAGFPAPESCDGDVWLATILNRSVT